VIKVWKINWGRSSHPECIENKFYNYQLRVAIRTGIPGGNTRRRFHGTVRECRLGDTSTAQGLCLLDTCNLCRIIQNSFEIARVGERTNFGRFGAGIYTSATSSKANDYTARHASPNKAMLLNYVVMGRAIKLTRTNQRLTQPPHGFDSVIGEPGGGLNYDESVVYNNDAILPAFLIVYR